LRWGQLRSLKEDVEAKYVDVKLVKMYGADKWTSDVWLIGADGSRGVVRKHFDACFDVTILGGVRISRLDGNVSELERRRAFGAEGELLSLLQHWHMWATHIRATKFNLARKLSG
jgi:2-polyprenyl-6-methoxyphenol hydroxylase-like FAD-dependent oxidoreductase